MSADTPQAPQKYLFFCARSEELSPEPPPDLEPPYTARLWRPALWKPMPGGLPDRRAGLTFLFWWAAYTLLTGRAGYRFLLVYHGGTVVHFTGLLPACPKFPFMAQGDLQLGPAYTHPDHRRRGLLRFAVARLTAGNRRPGRLFWWLCRAENVPSQQAIRGAGFRLRGEGAKRSRRGGTLFSLFVLQESADEDAEAAWRAEPGPAPRD